ncbi:MAG: EF2563 family selenium-dependent molybdenum hydroxylase system protein [Desulfobacterales bacterium]|nr:EF2563 family selenium-dependent molybdenum hydroxylase system protein [Desulfobacterales bacterium]
MSLNDLKIVIKGAGEMASGVACRLNRSNFKVCLTEISQPLAVRREVSFCEVIYDKEKTIEGISAKFAGSFDQVREIWAHGDIPVIVDPEADVINHLRPDVLVDAILAKKNLGTKINHAPLVIGLGPGFCAGKDVHIVVETNRGHDLGRVITEGEAEENTGIPGMIAGYGAKRVFRAPKDGRFSTLKQIGDFIEPGEVAAEVEGIAITAQIKGIIRGMLRDGTEVHAGIKAGDIDPRGIKESCYTVSEKALAIGGGVLEGILSRFNQ